MKGRGIYIIIILCSLLFVSCEWNQSKKKEEQKLDMTIHRYDKLLNEYVEFNSFSALQKMNTTYLQETKYLIEDVLRLGQVDDNNINGKLKVFYSDSTLHKLSKDALERFEDMSVYEKEFTRGFKNLRKEIPAVRIPRLYSQISALNESVVVGDSVLGFSIDKYMGEDYPLYKQFFYNYQCKSMNPDRIVPDCFMFFLLREYPFPWEQGRTLLDLIMHRGKIHYVIRNILDYKPGREFGYTEEEEQWCETNRKHIWEYMLQNRHLYVTDMMLVRKYIEPSPYTAFFGEEAPQMVGTWMGMQIIDSYMKHNKNITIAELLEDTNYRSMLEKAQFKP